MVCGAHIVLENFCAAAIMWLVLHRGIHPSFFFLMWCCFAEISFFYITRYSI